MTIIQPPDFSPIETRQTRSGSLNISHASLNKSSAKTPRKSSKSPNEGSKLSSKPLNSSLTLDKPNSPQIGTVLSNKSLAKTPRKASKSPAKSKIVPPTPSAVPLWDKTNSPQTRIGSPNVSTRSSNKPSANTSRTA